MDENSNRNFEPIDAAVITEVQNGATEAGVEPQEYQATITTENISDGNEKRKKSMGKIIAVAVIGVVIIAMAVFICINAGKKPLNADELLSLGEKYLVDLNYEQAIVQFLEVIKIEPMNISAYLGGADAYLHLKKQQDAIDLLTRGIDATKNKNLSHALDGVKKSLIDGYISIAEAYEAEGMHDKALEILKRVYNETNDEIIGRKLGIVKASEINFKDDYIIKWDDAAFERMVRQMIGKESGDIHYDDVKSIQRISIWGSLNLKGNERYSYWENGFRVNGSEHKKDGEIRTLADLVHFSSLTDLEICYQPNLSISALDDVDSIDCLRRLQTLTLVGDNLSEIRVVSGLYSLRDLTLSYNNITDISPITLLIEMEYLNLNENKKIASGEPIQGLRNLKSAGLSSIDNVDLTVLKACPELSSLNLVDNKTIDYTTLLDFKKLNYLEITCDDSTFQTVKQLKSLQSLRLHGQGMRNDDTNSKTVGLTNISGIGALTNLTKLDLLAPECHDISALAPLKITEIELDLPNDCDLTPLKKIASLKKVIIDDYHGDPSSGNGNGKGMLKKAQKLLPGIEVTDERY